MLYWNYVDNCFNSWERIKDANDYNTFFVQLKINAL